MAPFARPSCGQKNREPSPRASRPEPRELARETENLRRVIDRVRGLQRILLSLLGNRLSYQRHSSPNIAGRETIEAIGRTLPVILETIAEQMENPGQQSAETERVLAEFRALEQTAHDTLRVQSRRAGHSIESRLAYERMRAQLGFYEHLDAIIRLLEKDTWALHIRQDNFTLAAWFRGSKERRSAPSIRPA